MKAEDTLFVDLTDRLQKETAGAYLVMFLVKPFSGLPECNRDAWVSKQHTTRVGSVLQIPGWLALKIEAGLCGQVQGFRK